MAVSGVGSEVPVGDELAAVFARTSGLLLSTETVHTALRLITSSAVEMIPCSLGAGVSLLDAEGRRVTAASTDTVVEQADTLQYELRTGPCLTAWDQHELVCVNDIAHDDRWPAWSRAVAELGMRSALSAPLVAGSRALGAVKVYAAKPVAFGGREERLLTMFAAHAAILLTNMRSAEDARRISGTLKDALRSREVTSLARGVIMAREGVDERTAFLSLADSARQHDETVRQAAERIARSTVRRLR